MRINAWLWRSEKCIREQRLRFSEVRLQGIRSCLRGAQKKGKQMRKQEKKKEEKA
jgi:hypothetical protein